MIEPFSFNLGIEELKIRGSQEAPRKVVLNQPPAIKNNTTSKGSTTTTPKHRSLKYRLVALNTAQVYARITNLLPSTKIGIKKKREPSSIFLTRLYDPFVRGLEPNQNQPLFRRANKNSKLQINNIINLQWPLSSSPTSLPSQNSPHLFTHSIQFHISNSTLHFPLKSHLYPSNLTSFKLHSSADGVALQEIQDNTQETALEENTQEKAQKRKLFVFNFPWSLSPDDLRKMFSECGTVREAEIIRNKDGKYRGFAFITMSSGEEAQAVLDKFNSKELGGRIIKVEFARRLKKPRPQPSTDLPVKETRHKIYVSNFQWKARSSHLREFFSADFNPVSARVVFENPEGRSAGYGFVSFSTREEAEAGISSLNGKELLGRPVTLKFSERTTEVEATNKDGEDEEKENQDESLGTVTEEEVSNAEHKS